MSAPGRQTLWARLREAALVEGDVPAPRAAQAPWFVRAMLGIAGWIGALFLFSFVGAVMAALIETPMVSIIGGSVVCAGAALLFRWKPDHDFLAQFGFAASLAGQAMILFGVSAGLEGWSNERIAIIATTMAIVQTILFFLAPDFLHRVWTAWTGGFALAVALSYWWLSPYAPAVLTAAFVWVWLIEFDPPDQGTKLRAGGYGLTLAAVMTVLLHSLLQEPGLGLEERPPLGGVASFWLGPALCGTVLVWAVLRLLRREGVPVESAPGRIALAGAAILAVATLWAPGLATMMAILLLGYANGNRVLTGLGILALLGYLSCYYYLLEITLLEKSALLVVVGVALLLARLALHRWWPAAQEIAADA